MLAWFSSRCAFAQLPVLCNIYIIRWPWKWFSSFHKYKNSQLLWLRNQWQFGANNTNVAHFILEMKVNIFTHISYIYDTDMLQRIGIKPNGLRWNLNEGGTKSNFWYQCILHSFKTKNTFVLLFMTEFIRAVNYIAGRASSSNEAAAENDSSSSESEWCSVILSDF